MSLAISSFKVLDDLEELQICKGYRINGNTGCSRTCATLCDFSNIHALLRGLGEELPFGSMPSTIDDMDKVEPIYETVPGSVLPNLKLVVWLHTQVLFFVRVGGSKALLSARHTRNSLDRPKITSSALKRFEWDSVWFLLVSVLKCAFCVVVLAVDRHPCFLGGHRPRTWGHGFKRVLSIHRNS